MNVYCSVGRMSVLFAFALAIAGCDKPHAGDDEDQTVSFSPEKIQLGDFPESSAITASVCVKNGSDSPVEMENLELSCGCLSSDFQPGMLAAGSEYKFNVRLREPQPGLGWQIGELITNPPLPEPATFELRYNVIADTHLLPETAFLGVLDVSETEFPYSVPFAVESLTHTLALVEPASMVRQGQTQSAIAYSLEPLESISEDESFIVKLFPRPGFLGTFSDDLVIVAKTKDRTFRFPVSISGSLVDFSEPIQ